MGARDKSRFSTKQAAWIAMGVFAGWLVFLLVPTPRKAKPPASNELPPMAAQSKLESVGLANNPDWLGLPDYFVIWADSAVWSEDRTYFAYWNPGSYSYSYFFEAVREGGKISFKNLPAIPPDGPFIWDGDDLAEYAKNRKGDSPTHPFVFAVKMPVTVLPARQLPLGGDPAGKWPQRVELQPDSKPIQLPSVKFPEHPNAEPKK